jgi:hypothetical protein
MQIFLCRITHEVIAPYYNLFNTKLRLVQESEELFQGQGLSVSGRGRIQGRESGSGSPEENGSDVGSCDSHQQQARRRFQQAGDRQVVEAFFVNPGAWLSEKKKHNNT